MVTSDPQRERAILARVDYRDDGWSSETALEELALLCETADLNVVGSVTQNLDHPHPRSYVGTGKLDELIELMDELEATVVVFDDELSPGQLRNIERKVTNSEELERKVIDRPTLILDIFARHAVTHEGRLQVELAQLEYRLPRLTNMWSHLSRQGVGGVGLRGPGETQLEVDRRLAENRIHQLKQQLEQVHRHRELYRRRRRRSGIPIIALVGYTNAGKSTLLNYLTDAGVIQRDQLFATLDPTTRRIRLPSSRAALITDTVGFIHNLPPTLIAAFRATLEEVSEATVLVHVLDVTSPSAVEQADTVLAILDDLGLEAKPVITVLNKVDRVREQGVEPAVPLDGLPEDHVAVSAVTGEGIDSLLEAVDHAISSSSSYAYLDVLIPYDRSELVDLFHRVGQIEDERFSEQGTVLGGFIPARYRDRFVDYQCDTSAIESTL